MNIFDKDSAGHSAHGVEGAHQPDWRERLGLKSLPPAVDKAGVVVHGMLAHDPLTHMPFAKPIHYVVAPWSQGRFTDDTTKLYFLAKGSVDPHENSFQAALRESHEETGVNVFAIAEGFVPGVTVKENDHLPLERIIHGSSGHPWHTQMFPIEVECIDRLMPYLKNRQVQVDAPFTANVTQDSVPYARNADLPTFDEMMHWLRSGKMPGARWNEGKNIRGTGLATASVFVELEQQMMRELIAERKQKDEPGKPLLPGRAIGDDDEEIKSPTEFGIFRDRLSHKDRDWLDVRLKQIKQVLLDYETLGDDHATIKIDMKERPLQFYQEGADLIPMSEYITRIVKQSLVNDRYDRNMVGSRVLSGYKHGANHHLIDAVARKEIAMLAPVILPADIEQADIPRSIKYALQAIIAGYNPDKQALAR